MKIRVPGSAIATLVVAWGLAGLAAPALAQDAIEGEYGLRVRYVDVDADAPSEGREMAVGWLTATPRPGLLEVLVDDDVVVRRETPSGQAHEVRFPRPAADALVLRYGAADASADDAGPPGGGSGALHETEVRLRPSPEPPPSVIAGVDSLFVLGDVHGEYESLVRVLRVAGFVDADGRWSGGRRHVVFLGDVFDRGPDVTKTLWFLYRLEREAEAAGGGAHVVLGNHEIMIFARDLRYVSQKERLVARLHGAPYYDLYDLRSSVLGRWLARRPAVMTIDDLLLVHGGVTPDYARFGVEELNDSIRSFIAEDLFYEWSDTTVAVVRDSALVEPAEEIYRKVLVMDSAAVARRNDAFFGEEGPFWHRGYVRSDTLSAALEEVLERRDVWIHVVGHTPVPRIESRYGGRLLAVDLQEPATEALLLVRETASGGYRGLVFDLEGEVREIEVAGHGEGR